MVRVRRQKKIKKSVIKLMREDTQESLRKAYTEEVEKRNDNDVDITRLRQQEIVRVREEMGKKSVINTRC